MIALESGVTSTVDPLGGSEVVERLTARIEDEARALIDKVDEMGGVVAAIERGYVQRQLHDSAFAQQQRVECGDQQVVGVNSFKSDEPSAVPLLRIDPEQEAERRERMADFRRSRDASGVQTALDAVRESARRPKNLLPPIHAAVLASATLGEISDALRDVFGTHD